VIVYAVRTNTNILTCLQKCLLMKITPECCAVTVQQAEDCQVSNDITQEVQTASKDPDTQSINHSDTTSQQGGKDKSSEQCSEGKPCQCVMAKANSLNEVNSRDFDAAADVAYARISLDAESGPAASRRRRKRYSPGRNSSQKVSADNAVNTIGLLNVS